ncbi:hypothetical protein ABZ215_24800 [Amycolatopsis sp. NPDC006131]|uniref:hypothetical protein n=1 Tax=Amycolatopsis sp. NPDC006131 TaxID=3156731 RepID=UPI00339E9B7C
MSECGAVVAIANLTAVCNRYRSEEPCECGPWAFPGHFHWRLTNVRPLTTAIPAKGRLGLWECDLGDQEPETLEHVFWRLLGEGVTVAKMAAHPDYRAAYDREGPFLKDLVGGDG